MVSQIFNILTYPVNVVFGWFYSVLNATGLSSFLFATLILVLIGAIVILPIRGGRVGGGALTSIATKSVRDVSEPSRRR